MYKHAFLLLTAMLAVCQHNGQVNAAHFHITEYLNELIKASTSELHTITPVISGSVQTQLSNGTQAVLNYTTNMEQWFSSLAVVKSPYVWSIDPPATAFAATLGFSNLQAYVILQLFYGNSSEIGTSDINFNDIQFEAFWQFVTTGYGFSISYVNLTSSHLGSSKIDFTVPSTEAGSLMRSTFLPSYYNDIDKLIIHQAFDTLKKYSNFINPQYFIRN